MNESKHNAIKLKEKEKPSETPLSHRKFILERMFEIFLIIL